MSIHGGISMIGSLSIIPRKGCNMKELDFYHGIGVGEGGLGHEGRIRGRGGSVDERHSLLSDLPGHFSLASAGVQFLVMVGEERDVHKRMC